MLDVESVVSKEKYNVCQTEC